MIKNIVLKPESTLMKGRLLENLRDRFGQNAQDLGVPEQQISDLWQDLLVHYDHKNRHYHNFYHLASIFAIATTTNPKLAASPIFSWTTWLHDIIYQGHRKDNEARSAHYWEEKYAVFADQDLIAAVSNIIHSTAKHQLESDTAIGRQFLDCDLAILAAPPDIYDQYSAAIRREYWMFPDTLYYRGRKKVLAHFLERDHLYFTDHFIEYHEADARMNLLRELQ